MSRWDSERMLTPKCFESVKWCRPDRRLSRQTRTRRGSRETEAKELTVSPYGCPSVFVVTTVTPLPQLLMTWRKRSGVTMAGYSNAQVAIIAAPEKPKCKADCVSFC